jgi:GntR family transcriptional regulator
MRGSSSGDAGAAARWLPAASTTVSCTRGRDLHDASLHAVLGEKFGVQIVSGKRQIRAVPGDRDLLRLLQLEASSPVLLLEGTSFDQKGRPGGNLLDLAPPDQVAFDLEIQREPLVPGGPASSSLAGDIPGAVADRPRQLGADLVRFADSLR